MSAARSVPVVVAGPPVKMAGGKSRLLPQLRPLLAPPFGVYHEPFVGGCSVALDLVQRLPEHETDAVRISLSDSNPALVALLVTLREDAQGVVDTLRQKYDASRSRERYNEERAAHNERMRFYVDGEVDPELAAGVLYLNRTCFNGLWRTNRKGEFNVPFGEYSQPLVFDEANLLAVGRVLRRATVSKRDFREALASVAEGDLVYLDPPYAPVVSGRVKADPRPHEGARGEHRSFTRYGADDFTHLDQEALRDEVVRLARLGARVVLSNSVAARGLYEGQPELEVRTVRNSRTVGARGNTRGDVDELLVLGGFPR